MFEAFYKHGILPSVPSDTRMLKWLPLQLSQAPREGSWHFCRGAPSILKAAVTLIRLSNATLRDLFASC